MPSCSEFLRKCWWRGEERNCSDLFDVRKTDDGFCCSFNTVSLAEGFAKPETYDDTDTDTDYADYQDYGSDYPDDGDTEFQQIGDQAGYDSW